VAEGAEDSNGIALGSTTAVAAGGDVAMTTPEIGVAGRFRSADRHHIISASAGANASSDNTMNSVGIVAANSPIM
jgi:hypothetical protein